MSSNKQEFQVHHKRYFASSRTISALILREMLTTYGTSPGGYLWAFLEPVAGIALLTFVFALALENPPLGQNFPFFYASGYLIFMAYLNITNKLTVAIRFSKPLLFYPTVRFTDALFARLILNVITELLIGITVFIGIVLWAGLPVDFDVGAICLALIMVFSLSLGIGTANCLLTSLFPLWERLWAILNRPLFVISTLFFLFESVPHPFDTLLWYNPLVHVVGQMRIGLYPTHDGQFVSPLYVIGVGMVCFAFGLLFLRRYYRDIINT